MRNAERGPRRMLYEVYARDAATGRTIMQPHEVIAANPFEAIVKAQRFFKMFLDMKRIQVDVNEIAVLESR